MTNDSRIAHVLRVAMAALAGFALCLVGCDTSASSSAPGSTVPLSDYTATYASYDAAGAASSSDGTASIDTSHLSDGYVAAAATDTARLKLQITCGDATYNYDLDDTGVPDVFPLSCGNGSYTFRIMRNTTGDRYAEVQSVTVDVSMRDEFQPFLRNSVVCDYDADSQCVGLADRFREESATELDLVTKIYDYITDNISYDYDKADTVEAGYLPDPDEVLSAGRGICFDYASLAAAMMRSQGIPCKIVTGYVDPDNIYHAWNIIYFEDTGWVSVEISVESDQWKRIDLTFAATGGDEGALGDDKTYTDRYVY